MKIYPIVGRMTSAPNPPSIPKHLTDPIEPKMKTPNTKENIEEFFEKIAFHANTEKLTTWEIDFLESLTRQFESRGTLSDKQFAILERIYCEKTE